jgi:predicted kinase
MTRPTLIIITGLPGTGKSALARELAGYLALPLFGKDQIKETLFDTLGWSDRAWSRRLGAASVRLLFRMVEAQLAARRSCIAESNFHPDLDTPHVRAIAERYPLKLVQLLCLTDGPVLLDRYRARAASGERHPGHCDDVLVEELAPQLLRGRLEPLAIDGPIVEVDTTDFAAVDARAIAERMRLLVEL